jgi:Flp pilus assembly protein TadD
MKQTLFTACILCGTLIVGCSEPESETVEPLAAGDASVLSTSGSDRESVGSEKESDGSDSEPTSTVSPPPQVSYPEKPEVLRLMHAANTEFDAGQFNDALESVEQALQVDPTSVVALDLRGRIVEILRRS